MLPINQIACEDNLRYLRKLPDNSVDLVVTDPPYNVSLGKDITFSGKKLVKEFGDWDHGFDPEPVLIELKRVLKPNGQIYIFCATKQIPLYMELFEKYRYFFRNLLVWSKTNPAPRISKFNWVFANEYIVYAINKKGKPSHSTFNFKKHSEMKNLFLTPTLLGQERVKDENRKCVHPTQKPLEILKKLIEVSSKKGDVVLDPFIGIGSTAVACKLTGRNFLGCDIEGLFCTYAKKRLEEVQ